MDELINIHSDERFMAEAYKEALKAFDADEVPVGAVIAHNNRIIARAHNLSERLTDVTAHAEMQAFTAAAATLGGKFLDECTLYVTLEPCVMCAGAAYWTRIGRIVFGAEDPKRGYRLAGNTILHPATTVTAGIMAKECGTLISEFFQRKRPNQPRQQP